MNSVRLLDSVSLVPFLDRNFSIEIEQAMQERMDIGMKIWMAFTVSSDDKALETFDLQGFDIDSVYSAIARRMSKDHITTERNQTNLAISAFIKAFDAISSLSVGEGDVVKVTPCFMPEVEATLRHQGVEVTEPYEIRLSGSPKEVVGEDDEYLVKTAAEEEVHDIRSLTKLLMGA